MNATASNQEIWPVLDSMATAVICTDAQLRIQYLNNAAEQLLGISARKALQQRLTRAITIPDTLFARIQKLFATGSRIPTDKCAWSHMGRIH